MWPNPQFSTDLVTFTEEILHGNFIFCAVYFILRTPSIVRNVLWLLYWLFFNWHHQCMCSRSLKAQLSGFWIIYATADSSSSGMAVYVWMLKFFTWREYGWKLQKVSLPFIEIVKFHLSWKTWNKPDNQYRKYLIVWKKVDSVSHRQSK